MIRATTVQVLGGDIETMELLASHPKVNYSRPMNMTHRRGPSPMQARQPCRVHLMVSGRHPCAQQVWLRGGAVGGVRRQCLDVQVARVQGRLF